jgi:N-hydroxyarylamine O-acetyltransferase
VDLKTYAARIEYAGAFAPTPDTLRAAHFAHATHIPFENLDVLLGRPIRLDEEGLVRKLVLDRRGGYCFEQNSLFALVLETAGFRVRRLSARVRMGASAGVRPRTHMLLLVETAGEQWIADVGFGLDGLLHPIPFLPGAICEQFSWQHRVMQDGAVFVLQCWRAEGWIDLYAFTLEEHFPIDFEVANHFTATHPSSIFRRMLRVQLPGPACSLMLVNHTLTERTANGATESTVPDDGALLDLLARRFGLHFPPGTSFPISE